MKLGTIMTMLGLGAVLAACDCCPQGEAKALSQSKTETAAQSAPEKT